MTMACADAVTECNELQSARMTLRSEAAALLSAADRIDQRFVTAVDLLDQMTGKAVLLGVGKSGNIAHKIASTFCSIGVPAVFLHPTDALHGDLGLIREQDVVILVSKSGDTTELKQFLTALRRACEVKAIGILGNAESELGQQCHAVIDASIDSEACPLNLAPMTSTTLALVLVDALASCLMQRRSFSAVDFGRLHPGGNLGKRLLTRVCDIMHTGESLPLVEKGTPLKESLFTMTSKGMGAALVSENGYLVGIVTDGDLRRVMDRHASPLSLAVEKVATHNPIVCKPDDRIWDAISTMEQRPSQLSVLPVIDDSNRIVGIVRLHDLIRHGLISSSTAK
jgi:arabinose-5-phosphate isomerase